MKPRLLFLLRLAITILLLFVGQKIIFFVVNISYTDGFSVGDLLAVIWHGLRLDLVTTCHLLIIPLIIVAISLFVPRLNPRKILRFYYLPIAILMTLAFIADMVLYIFWGAKIDAADFIYAQNPKDLFASVTWWQMLLGALVIIFFAWHYYQRFRNATPEEAFPHASPLWLLLWPLLLGGTFLGMRGGVRESTANPSYAYFSPKPFLNHAALNPLFNIVHSIGKQEDLSNQFQYYADDELEQLTQGLFPQDCSYSDTLLAIPRPNILLIVWEGAGSRMVLNDSVAPNLVGLLGDGVYFSRCHANNFRTDRGTVSLLNGWPGLPTTSLMKHPDQCRKLPALAKTLREAGYHTGFYYGGDIDFTNMRCYLAETGFEEVHGDEYFSHETSRCKWGLNDEALLRLPLPNLESPFFLTLLTLSSHEPWDVPYHRLAESHQNAFAYTDSCLGAFIRSLRQTPQWDSLLVIIVPDHGVPTAECPSTSDYRVSEIPMLWLGGAIRTPKDIDILMNQSDLAATLLSQMGLTSTDFIFSRNILAPSYTDCFVLHAYKNGMNYIDEDGFLSYDCTSHQVVGGNGAEGKVHRAKALLQAIYTRVDLLHVNGR